ncbi:hypothetical protein C8R44DRAFT_726343 [Mycena epipterygia]|nr:hypothetical protein C8R44DRAFT_726343 [Mycena epipterygia]
MEHRKLWKWAMRASHSWFLAGNKLAEWLAKPSKWLASRKAGRGRVIPPKSTPPPGTSHSARAQAIRPSQKSLAALHDMIKPYIHRVAELLKDDYWPVQEAAANAIGKLVEHGASTTRCIIPSLLIVDFSAVFHEALRDSVPLIVGLLKDRYPEVRLASVNTVGKIIEQGKFVPYPFFYQT